MGEDVTRDARSRRCIGIVRWALVAGFAGAALHRISRPGPLYDEILFVNAALGGIDGSFVHSTVLGVPFMLMSYVGALKAWLHAPVFALFGVSIETLRAPSILIVCATLLILSRLGERLFGWRAGLLLTLVLVTDPLSLTTARVDYGPVVLAGLFKAASVALLFAWLERPSAGGVAALVAVLALGVFDKLNFVWFVLALGGAALLVERRRFVAALRASRPAVWLPIAVGAGALLYVGGFVVLPLLLGPGPGGDFPSTTLAERALALPTLVRTTLDGSAWWRIAFRTPAPARPEWATLEVSGLVVVASCAVLSSGVRGIRDAEVRRLARLAAFFAVLCALLLVQLAATPQANGPHHAAMLHPWPAFALLATGATLVAAMPSRARRRVGAGASLLVLVVVAGQVRFDAAYLAQLRDRGAIQSWASTAIYGLSRDLERLAPDLVVSADWGLHNQLFALAPPASRRRHRNLYALLQDGADLEQATAELAAALQSGKRVAVVLHPEDETMMRRARERVLAFAARRPPGSFARWPVTDASGHTVYEVLFLEPSAAP